MTCGMISSGLMCNLNLRRRGVRKGADEVIAEYFPNVMKMVSPQIQGPSPNRINTQKTIQRPSMFKLLKAEIKRPKKKRHVKYKKQ